MSGHSKWATIKHKKGSADAKRGKMFSKLAKEIMVVSRQGGGDPSANPTLRTLVQKAKSINMPGENIDRAIKKGTGELEGSTFEEVVYEGFASGGAALIVQCLTDNKNRAAAEIRHIFNKHGSSFAQQGAVSRGFQRKGQIFVDASIIDEDKLMSIVLEAGAEDMQQDGDQFEILTDPTSFNDVVEALAKEAIETASAELSLVPETYVPVKEKSDVAANMRFVSALEDNEDVQAVYTNMDVDDAMMEELSQEE